MKDRVWDAGLTLGAGRGRNPITAAVCLSIVSHVALAAWIVSKSDWLQPRLPAPALQVMMLAAQEVASVKVVPTKAPVLQDVPKPVVEPKQPVRKPVEKPVKRQEPAPIKKAVAPVVPAPVERASNKPDRQEPAPRQKEIEKPALPAYLPPTRDDSARDNAKPRYPAVALRRGIEGVVWLIVDVDEQGYPAHVEIKQSAGFRPLDNAALKAVRRWRFLPARRYGQTVSASVEVPVRFQLREKQAVSG